MRHLRVSGSPIEMGRIHGEEFKKQIHELAEIRTELLRKYLKSFNANEVKELVHSTIVYFQKNYPEFYQEFLGISQAAQIDPIDLMILNNYTDLRDFDHSDDGGCSGFWVHSGEKAICGQTWDMHASAEPYMMRLTVQNQDSPVEILTVTGCLALSGVNRHGVAILINNMHSSETSVGLMWPALVRGMLLQKSSQAALDYLSKNLPCSGHNYLISSSDEGMNVETTGKRYEVKGRTQRSGSVYHTNHYIGSLEETEILSLRSASSQPRYQALSEYFGKLDHSKMNVEMLSEAILAGKSAVPVCVHRPKEPHGTMTCGGIIYDFSQSKGLMFSGLYQDGNHLEFKFE